MVLAALFMAALAYSVITGALADVSGGATPEALSQMGNVQALGRELFTRFLLPFELASILLLVGMVGAVVLARRVRG